MFRPAFRLIFLFCLFLVISPASFAHQAGDTFTDCESCPDMVALPSGKAMIGAEPYEANRKRGDDDLRELNITYSLAIAKTEVTRAQYREFMESSGHVMIENGCNTWGRNRILGYVKNHRWDQPGYPQNEKHPVVCVSYDDAAAYAKWLSKRTNKPYRLLSSSEFEYATRAGTRGPWFWGSSNKDACKYANVGDAIIRRNWEHAPVFHCEDKYEYTAPVGSFEPNPWGLHDMLGNVWEWTEDCLHRDNSKAPLDGSAWTSEDDGECDRRIPRGGSWVSGTDWVRAAARSYDLAEYHSQLLGFRVALTLED